MTPLSFSRQTDYRLKASSAPNPICCGDSGGRAGLLTKPCENEKVQILESELVLTSFLYKSKPMKSISYQATLAITQIDFGPFRLRIEQQRLDFATVQGNLTPV